MKIFKSNIAKFNSSLILKTTTLNLKQKITTFNFSTKLNLNKNSFNSKEKLLKFQNFHFANSKTLIFIFKTYQIMLN